MPTTSRALTKVVERIVKPVYLAQHYHTFYVLEVLECGHRQVAYPQGDPLIAKYRVCSECVKGCGEGVLARKPPRSVRSIPQRADRAAA